MRRTRPGWLLVPLLLAAAAGAARAADELGPLRAAVAERACDAAVAEMRPARPKDDLLVFRLSNDPTGQVTALLKDRISSRGRFAVMQPGLVERLLGQIGVEAGEVRSAAEALAAGKKAGAKAVLLGRLDRLSVEEGDQAVIDLKLRILDVETGDGLFVGRYQEGLEKGVLSIPHFRAWMYDTALAYRGLIWLSVTLLLPLLSLLLRRMLDPKAPGVNVVLVALYTLIDAGVGFGLLGFSIPDPQTGIILLVATGVALFYNLSVCAKIAVLELHSRGGKGE